MTTPSDPSRPGAPTVREIAALTARLRDISVRGRDVDPAERAAFLADKDALIARITDATATADARGRAGVAAKIAARGAMTEVAQARAADPGYVLVGPSAQTWLRDPTTGRPTTPVSDAEHRAVRELLGREELDTTEPAWVTGPDGRDDIHSTVVPAAHTDDDDNTDEAPGRDGPEMPEWMRRQARDTEAAIAAGTLPDVYPDDRAPLGERIAALRAERDEAAPGASGEREPFDAAERAFDELCERHPLPGDGPGEWASDRRTGAHWWVDHGDVDDDTPISAEIATANPDIWDDNPDGHDDEQDAVGEYHRTAFLPHEGSRAWAEQNQQRHQVFGAALDRSGNGGGRAPEPEQDRREQLARWHAEDHAAAPDDTSVYFTCGGYDPDLGRD